MTTTSQSNANEQRYFNLFTSGLGYLNRIRDEKPPRGNPYLACDVNALQGPVEKASYVRYDVIVTGEVAKRLVRQCKSALDAEKKVLIGFHFGDMTSSIYVHQRGKKAGEQDVSLRTHLLRISWIKVDGKLVYQEAPKQPDAEDRKAEVHKAPAATEVQGKAEAAPAKFFTDDPDDEVTDVKVGQAAPKAGRAALAESFDDIPF